MEKEIKNTNPAVGTKPGGGGKEELVDENMRYTAGAPGQANENPDPDPAAPARSNIDQANRQLDKMVYTPAFEDASTKIYKRKITPGTKWQDKLGVDFETEPIRGENFIMQDDHYHSFDLKGVDDSLGDEAYYENPNITINLFKTFDNEDQLETIDKSKDEFHSRSQEIMSGEFHPGSFTNGRHINTDYAYIYPHCPQTREEILKGAVPDIDEARLFVFRTKDLNRYVSKRILQNDIVRNIIGYYTRNRRTDGGTINREIYRMIKAPVAGAPLATGIKIKQNNPNSIRILVPIAGENFPAELHMRIKSNGVRDVRLYIPSEMAHNPDMKRTIHKRIKLKND